MRPISKIDLDLIKKVIKLKPYGYRWKIDEFRYEFNNLNFPIIRAFLNNRQIGYLLKAHKIRFKREHVTRDGLTYYTFKRGLF